MTNNYRKRVIDLDPHDVREETLAELKEEVHAQSDDDLDDIEFIDTIVFDTTEDGGLNSHAAVFMGVNADE